MFSSIELNSTAIATGEVREYSWDRRNRLVTSITQSGDKVSEKLVDYTYDAASQGSRFNKIASLLFKLKEFKSSS